MLKLLQKKVLFSFCIVACFLLISSCYLAAHKPGNPGTMSMDNVFARHKTLANMSIYVTVADSKGIFARRTMEDFVYELSADNTYKYYQTAEHVLVASGNYKYILSAKKERLAFIRFSNQTGVFGKSTMNMQLNLYNPDMGTYKITLSRFPKTNFATGIFKIKPTMRR